MAAGKEVAVPEAAEVAIPDDMLREMEAASAKAKESIDLNTDVRLPQLRLVQATTQDIEANPGTIYDTLSANATSTVDVVPLSMWKTRALFDGSIGDPPSCTSPDAITGFGTPGGDCTRCPQADWRNGGKCQLRYNYLVMPVGDDFDPSVEMPRAVMMHGTSAKIASRLNTMLLASKFFWSNVVKLSSTTEKNDRGTYKVWDVKRDRASTPGEQMLAFGWQKQVAAARSVTIEGDNAAEAAPAPQPDGDIPF